MCRSSSTWLLLTADKERHLCRALQRANRIQETLTPRARGMPPTNPVWCTHACDNTQRYSMSCTYSRCLHTRIRGARKTTHAIQTQGTMEQEHQDDEIQGEPATPSTPSTTTQGGTQRPAGPDGLRVPGSRKHAPGTPPPRPTHAVHSEHHELTVHDHTNYDPGTAGTTGPLWGETIRGGERHDANWNRNQTKPHHNVPTTAPQAEPQVP